MGIRMKILKRLGSIRSESHHSCSKCHLRLRLTGEPPQNSSERLIESVAKGMEHPALHWLEQQIGAALYHEEVRRGAAAVDIGLLGPAVFRKEADRILADMRPEFGYLMDGGKERPVG